MKLGAYRIAEFGRRIVAPFPKTDNQFAFKGEKARG